MGRLILMLILTLSLGAQATRISVDDAIKIARESNLDRQIKAVQLEFGSKFLLQGYLNFAPTVTFDYSYVKLSEFALSQQQAQTEGFIGLLTAVANLPGTDPATRDQLLGVVDNIPLTAFEYVHRSSVNVDWWLFLRGDALKRISEYQNQQQIALIEQRELDRDIDYKVREAFYNLFIAQEALTLSKHRADNAKRRVTQIQRLVDQGLRPQNELLRWQLQESQVKTALLDANHQLRMAQRNLAYEMGVDLNRIYIANLNQETMNIDFSDLNMGRIQSVDVDQLDAIKKALLQLDIAQDNEFYTYGKFLPSVRVNWRKTWNQSDQAFPAEQPWEASINFSWEIFSSFRDYIEVQKNELMTKQTRLQVESGRRQTRLLLTQLSQNLERSLEQWGTSKLSVKFAEDNYRLMKNRFDQGLTTNLDLLDSEVQLFQTKIDELNAYRGYVLSGFALKRILGDMK